MKSVFSKRQIAIPAVSALAAFSAIGSATLALAPTAATATATAAGKTAGKYVARDFHNHTTCSDGALSMQKLVKKSTDAPGAWTGLCRPATAATASATAR